MVWIAVILNLVILVLSICVYSQRKVQTLPFRFVRSLSAFADSVGSLPSRFSVMRRKLLRLILRLDYFIVH